MANFSTDHYEVLGVARSATQEEVRRAYIEKIKVHTPESDPDTFRLISEAYRVLTNPEKRAEYDKAEQIPEHVQDRLNELMRLADDNGEAAARGMYELARENPSIRAVRFAYGVLLDRLERYRDSATVFRQLYDEEPDNASYATWLGDALLHCDEVKRGEQYLKEAIVLDKTAADAYFALARHWANNGRERQALELLHRGIHADEKADVTDLPLFIYRLLILARKEWWDELEREARAIARLPDPTDTDACAYVSSQLWSMVTLFQEADRPDLMIVVLDAIVSLDPSNHELRREVEKLRPLAGMIRERSQLLDDDSVAGWIHALVVALTVDGLNESDKQEALHNIAIAASVEGSKMRREYNSARRRYPTLLGDLQDGWNRLQNLVPKGLYTKSGGGGSGGGGGTDEGGGWCGLIILGVIIFFVIKGCS